MLWWSSWKLSIYVNEWLQWRQQFNYKSIFKETLNIPIRTTTYNGYKEESARYSRCLTLDSKPILWNHNYSVYRRDCQRHLFSTHIRSSHVHLDSLSKMRVKLAVQVLNSKVIEDMEKFESDSTSSSLDQRLKQLNDVLLFFRKWRD